jgi:hypothetical protein
MKPDTKPSATTSDINGTINFHPSDITITSVGTSSDSAAVVDRILTYNMIIKFVQLSQNPLLFCRISPLYEKKMQPEIKSAPLKQSFRGAFIHAHMMLI